MSHPFADLDWRPDWEKRRAFGKVLVLGFLGLGVLLWVLVRWKTGRWADWPLWLGGICASVGAVCWMVPGLGRPVYVVWHAVGGAISFAITNVLLLVIYFLVITPIGLVLRALGRDPLERRWDRTAPTYWKEAEKPVDAKRYFRQF
jgi:hypothetical protein